MLPKYEAIVETIIQILKTDGSIIPFFDEMYMCAF